MRQKPRGKKRGIRKRQCNVATLILLAALIVSLPTMWITPTRAADTYHVATTGSDVTGDGSTDNPWATIQHAIDQASSGDTITVAAGVYNERITIEKPLTLRGATANVNKNGYTVPTNYAWDSNVETIINNPTPELTATISVVTIKDTSDVTFEGFIVQSLNAPLGSANDMLLYIDVKSGTMENITIRNNVIGPNTNVADQDGTAGRMGLDISVNQYQETPYGLVNSSIACNKIFNCEGNGNNVFIWGAYYAYGARHPSPMEGTVIEDNEISGSHRSGIEIAGGISGLTIRSNTISDNSGLPTDDPTNLKYGNGIVIIRGSSDSGEEIGLGPENLTIKDNDIINNEKNGIYAGPVSKNYVITGNNIQNNGWDGIRLDMEAHYKNPTFEDEDRIGFFEAAENVTATHNNIYGNSELGVNVIGEPTNGFVLNATYNWWGTTDPDLVAASINGSVLFDPWLDPAYPDTLILNEKSGFYYQTIQSAIDAASDYDTINVPAGVYNERITIEKPLTLRGATVNVNKNGYTVPTIYVWDSNVETIINNPTPALEGSVVYIHDTNDVTFEGFIVQKLNAVSGRNNENVLTIEADSMTMQNITIRNNIIGPNTNVAEYQDGTYGRMGLYISLNQYLETPYGLVDSTISGNKIFDCTGNGDNIFIWGSYYAYGARYPSPMEGTVIEDNEITGSHRTGIEISGGCSGLTIQNNIISNNKGLPTDDPILKYGSGIVLIRGSSDSKSSKGLGPESLTIVGNDIFGNEKNGIYMGPVSKNHNITGNNIHDNGWDGIRLDMEAHYYNPDFETVDRTALFNATENIMTTYNNIYDNSELGVNVVGTPENDFVLNAPLNWWGAASGPDDDAEVINGDGDKISERVVADPWIHDAYGLSMEKIVEPEGERYGSAPKFSNFGFDAAIHNLKSGWYKLDSGTWNVLFADVDVPEWNSDNWQVPEFTGLAEGDHIVYFKVADVYGHESDVWSWQFCKDKAPPTISNSQINPDSGTPRTKFTITADVEDPAGIQSVRASIQKPDETEVASVELTSGSSYSGIWDSTGVLEGTYYVDITATDKVGNSIEEENALHFPLLAMPVINWTCECIPANQTNYEFDAKNKTGASIFLNTSTGTPTVTVACCKPENATGFSCDVDKYIDVQLDDATGVTSLEITIYYTQAEIEGLVEADLRLYWWNGTTWKMCSNTGVNTTDCDCYSGYIWAEITADSEPSLSDLTGTPFGANSVEHPIGGTFGHTSTVHLLEKFAGRFLVEHWLIVVAFGVMMVGVGLIIYPRKQSSPSF
jgi:parallel beta-helix repeat protein